MAVANAFGDTAPQMACLTSWEKKKEDGTALTTVERTAAFEQFIERMLTRHLQLEAAEATEWTKRVIKKNNAGTTINVKNVATKSP